MRLFAFKLNDQSLRLGAELPGTDRLIDLHASGRKPRGDVAG